MPYKINQSFDKARNKKREELVRTVLLTLSGSVLTILILNTIETIIFNQ